MKDTDFLHRQSEARFLRDVEGFEMTVAHDEGLYRHVRFRQPDRALGCYWFDLITWPGRLSIVADMGSFTFSRLPDMFEFFAGHGGYINPHYWGEKLIAYSTPVEGFDWDSFVQHVTEYFTDSVEYWVDEDDAHNPARLWWTLRSELLEDEIQDEQTANAAAGDFSYQGWEFSDTWEWRSRDWSHSYLWCCHAIRWGIGQYRAAKAAAA